MRGNVVIGSCKIILYAAEVTVSEHQGFCVLRRQWSAVTRAGVWWDVWEVRLDREVRDLRAVWVP